MNMKTLLLFTLALVNGVIAAQPLPEQQIFADIERGDLKRVEEALKAGVSVDATDRFGQTLLMRAASAKSLSIVRSLIDRGADIRAKDRYGFTVIDILESNIRRSGKNRDHMIEGMKNQGLSTDQIEKMLGPPAAVVDGKSFTEDDRRAWEEILQLVNSKK